METPSSATPILYCDYWLRGSIFFLFHLIVSGGKVNRKVGRKFAKERSFLKEL